MNPVKDDYVHLQSSSPETVTVKDETVNDNDGSKLKPTKPTSSSNKIEGNKKFRVIRNNLKNSPNIPTPVQSAGIAKLNSDVIAGKRVINPENGNHQCRICNKEYSKYPNFFKHFKTAHMKIRYKCPMPICGKSFALWSKICL